MGAKKIINSNTMLTKKLNWLSNSQSIKMSQMQIKFTFLKYIFKGAPDCVVGILKFYRDLRKKLKQLQELVTIMNIILIFQMFNLGM